MTKGDKGGMSEAIFICESFKRGWEVAKPFNHQQGYDFVIRRNSKEGWKTVQVKTIYSERGSSMITFRRSQGGTSGRKLIPYKAGDFDFICAIGDSEIYLIPWDVLIGKKSCVSVGSKKYKDFSL